MTHVMTLIGTTERPLAQAEVDEAAAVLRAERTGWLRHGVAADLFLDQPEGAEDAALALLAEAPVDIVFQPAANRRKKLLLADMDSTVIQQECVDELADVVGVGAEVAGITERAMRGELEFEPALRERVALLKGLPVEALESALKERITETPGGRALTATMKAHGATCVLVSGGFTFFTERVAERVGFAASTGNRLLIEDGRLTGKVGEPIFGRDGKVEALKTWRARLGLTKDETMAVGDGANDLGMIGEAGFGVAFHAKPVVAEAADARIDHGDLESLLYLQGYSDTDILNA